MLDIASLSDISGLLTTLAAAGIAVVFWFNRQRLGLGEVQVATNLERDRVIELQEQRIELLEQKVEAQTARIEELSLKIKWLQFENENLRRGDAKHPEG